MIYAVLFWGSLAIWVVAAALFVVRTIDRRGRFRIMTLLALITLVALLLSIFLAGAKYADLIQAPHR